MILITLQAAMKALNFDLVKEDLQKLMTTSQVKTSYSKPSKDVCSTAMLQMGLNCMGCRQHCGLSICTESETSGVRYIQEEY